MKLYRQIHATYNILVDSGQLQTYIIQLAPQVLPCTSKDTHTALYKKVSWSLQKQHYKPLPLKWFSFINTWRCQGHRWCYGVSECQLVHKISHKIFQPMHSSLIPLYIQIVLSLASNFPYSSFFSAFTHSMVFPHSNLSINLRSIHKIRW